MAIPLCEYCRSYNYDYFGITDLWRQIGEEAKLEDWRFDDIKKGVGQGYD